MRTIGRTSGLRVMWTAVRRSATLVLLLYAAAFANAKPQEQTPASTSYSAQELVRRMIDNELRCQDQDHSKYRFLSRKEQEGKVVVQEKVQTSGGTLKRTLLLNGKSLPPDEAAKEESKLEELVRDKDAQEKKRREEREDAEKARRMFRMFPDAFLYTHAGEENGLIMLHFVPNPDFSPPTREATVFHAMSGTMWIHPKQMRFVKMQASLTDDVKFGWGLLGHLDRGGTMLVEQQEVAPNHWEVTTLDLNLKGKAVFFKSINVQEKETNSRFQRLDDNIDLARGLELLKRGDQTVAGVGGK
jgi:hypothetical protein